MRTVSLNHLVTLDAVNEQVRDIRDRYPEDSEVYAHLDTALDHLGEAIRCVEVGE